MTPQDDARLVIARLLAEHRLHLPRDVLRAWERALDEAAVLPDDVAERLAAAADEEDIEDLAVELCRHERDGGTHG